MNLFDKGLIEFACLYSSQNYPSNLKARSCSMSNLFIWYLGDESFITVLHHLHPSGILWGLLFCPLISKTLFFKPLSVVSNQRIVADEHSRPQTFGMSWAHKGYVGLISDPKASLKSLVQQHQRAALRSRHRRLFITGYRLLPSLWEQVVLSELLTWPYLIGLLDVYAEQLNWLVGLISYQYLKEIPQQKENAGGVRAYLLIRYEIMLCSLKFYFVTMPASGHWEKKTICESQYH